MVGKLNTWTKDQSTVSDSNGNPRNMYITENISRTRSMVWESSRTGTESTTSGTGTKVKECHKGRTSTLPTMANLILTWTRIMTLRVSVPVTITNIYDLCAFNNSKNIKLPQSQWTSSQLFSCKLALTSTSPARTRPSLLSS